MDIKRGKDVVGLDIDNSDYSDIIQAVDNLDNKKGWEPLKIAFLRNIVIDPIIPFLKFLCFEEGVKADIYMSDYDNVMQDVLNSESSLYKYQPDIIVVCLKIEALWENLSKCFVSIYPKKINEEVQNFLAYVDQVCQGIRKNSNTVVLVHNVEIPVYPDFGILDSQDHSKQINTFRHINLKLVDLVNKYENIFTVDIDQLQSIAGYNRFFDNRYWHIGRAPYTREALKLIAKEYIKFIRAQKGKNRKCLVLDCDNTLWGGIVGEDGIDNIHIGRTYPGSVFLEFQQAVLNLHRRGVILAICSRNNEEDVLNVFNNHPDMVLREDHFSSIRVNWNDKVANLKEISNELNLGLDSMVFIDDNEFETNMVMSFLPEVKTIGLPKDPTTYRDILNSSGLFDSLIFSEEDILRGQLYKAEAERKKLKLKSTNLDEYFRSLEMEATINYADTLSIPRITQLTQRTNQFNLTSKRFIESDIKELSNSHDSEVFSVRLKDRYGDAGIIGAAIIMYKEESAIIDTFLLSCRVVGRGIENVILKACIESAVTHGKKEIYGLYIKTKKNSLVADFYTKCGFCIERQNENETSYQLSLDKPLLKFPCYFKSIDINRGQ